MNEAPDKIADAAFAARAAGWERLCLKCLHGFNGTDCPSCGVLTAPGSRGAPTAALTVERLAALLKLLAHTAEMSPRTYEAEAAWLLPRLHPVGAPTPAMIAAAARALWGLGNARIGYREYSASLKRTYEYEADVALRAALTAPESEP